MTLGFPAFTLPAGAIVTGIAVNLEFSGLQSFTVQITDSGVNVGSSKSGSPTASGSCNPGGTNPTLVLGGSADLWGTSLTATEFNAGDVGLVITPSGSNLVDSVSITVHFVSDPDIELTSTESADPVTAGSGAGNLTYVVTAENLGLDATGVEASVTVTWPGGTTVDSVTPSGSGTWSNTFPGTWTIGNLNSGASETLTFVLTVGASTAEGADTIALSANVSALNETDSNNSNDSTAQSTSVTRSADLSITKADSADPAIAGADLTYTVTVDNAGPSDASGVVVTETLPAGTTLVQTTGCSEDPVGAPTCTLGTIPAGDSAQYSVEVTLDSDLADGALLSNSVTVAANEDDPTPGNDAIAEGTTVAREVDITLLKSESIDPVVAGSGDDNLTYTVTATNNGPSDVTDLVISDAITLPANVTLDSVTPSAGGWTSPNWTVSIPAGGSETLTIVIDVPLAADEGTDVISDTATVQSSGGGETFINTGDDSVTESTSIVWPEATFNVQKQYLGDDGGPVTATLNCSDTSGLLVYAPQQGTTPTALTVRRFDDGGTTCTVTESDIPGGFFVADRSAGCDVNPVTDGGSYDCTLTNANTRATFEVTKDFTDDNPSEVEMTISCNTGIVIEQSQGVSESRSVEFVVIAYDDGELACEITEEDLAGYNVSYDDGTPDSTSCSWEGIAGGAELTCAITNTPAPVDVVITKDWVFEGTTDGEGIDLRYELTLFCDAEIVGGTDIFGDLVESPSGNGPGCGLVLASQEGGQGIVEIANWCKVFHGEGPMDATHTAEVIPEYPDSNCYVVENVFDNAVEVDNGCTSLTVSAGQGDSCTVTNTVFFEGIPTLNQYGLAVLALLMLGIGFVGFRRFA